MTYTFEDFTLDPEALELRKAGAPVALEPKVFDVLAHLVGRPGQLVSKEDLIETVWKGRAISDAALSTAIKTARAAVGDSGSEQRLIKTVHGRGVRFVGNVSHGDTAGTASAALAQSIRFCHAVDGTRIAYATSGDGPALVKSSNWMSHLEFELDSPIWRPWIEGLSKRFRVVRYDERGNGLSARTPEDVSFETRVRDLESVVEAARPEEPFILFGISAGTAISIEYAARHPEKVRGLVLLGGFVKGWRATDKVSELAQAMTAMIRKGWGRNNPAFRQLFTSLFFPDADAEQTGWFNDLQSKTVTPEIAALHWEKNGDIDVEGRLAGLNIPALVIHSIEDVLVPVTNGEAIASALPDARFLALQSNCHVPLGTEPAFQRMFEEIDRFILELTP